MTTMTASTSTQQPAAPDAPYGGVDGRVDLSFVLSLHGAFRRDFRALARALRATRSAGGPSGAQITRFHDMLIEQLHHHHGIEDADLMPLLAAKVRDPQMTRALETVTRQHGEMDGILARVEAGMRGVRLGEAASDELIAAVDELIAHLDEHLDDEERDAFPVLEKLMTAREFERFETAVKKKMGLRGAAVTFPWVMHGADEQTRRTVLAQLPPPLRLLCRAVWMPAFRRKYALPA